MALTGIGVCKTIADLHLRESCAHRCAKCASAGMVRFRYRHVPIDLYRNEASAHAHIVRTVLTRTQYTISCGPVIVKLFGLPVPQCGTVRPRIFVGGRRS